MSLDCFGQAWTLWLLKRLCGHVPCCATLGTTCILLRFVFGAAPVAGIMQENVFSQTTILRNRKDGASMLYF